MANTKHYSTLNINSPMSHTVAIAYVMQKVPYVFPIVGGRKVEHLHANLEALNVALTPAHIRKIEGAVPLEPGVPHNLTGDGTSYSIGYASAGQFDMWPLRQAIRPSESL